MTTGVGLRLDMTAIRETVEIEMRRRLGIEPVPVEDIDDGETESAAVENGEPE